MKIILTVAISVLACMFFVMETAKAAIGFVEKPDRIDVTADGKPVTSYIYGNDPNFVLAAEGRMLTRPVLYPVYSPSGVKVTRCFPIERLEGETEDHPHHTGLFFAYDDVGDEKGFWGNSRTPLPAIRHVRTLGMAGGEEKGVLSVLLHWVGKDGQVVIEEKRDMVFHAEKDRFTIDFAIDLAPLKNNIVFHDTKEGMFAIRVADWLREKDGTGTYLDADGRTTEEKVWGLRSRWMRLEGCKDGKTIGVAIFHAPSSVNYPTYWMARGYGLFSANPLGQYVYQKHHKQRPPLRLDLALESGQAAYFGFRVVVYDGHITQAQLEELAVFGIPQADGTG